MEKTLRFGTVVLGSHCAFAGWTFDVVRALASGDPAAAVMFCERHDHLRGVEAPRAIYLSHYPGPSMISAIEAGTLRVVLIEEAPADAIAFMCRTLGIDRFEALRAQSASCVAARAIGAAGRVAVFRRESNPRVWLLAKQLAVALECDVDDAHIDETARRLGTHGNPHTDVEGALAAHVPGYAPPCAVRDSGDPAVLQVLEPLARFSIGDFVRPVVWSKELFTFSDATVPGATGATDGPGAAQVFISGPRLHMPPGAYRIEAVLAFCEPIEDALLLLEVHSVHCLRRVRMHWRNGGLYRGYFEFVHSAPLETIEIRLSSHHDIKSNRLSDFEIRFFAI